MSVIIPITRQDYLRRPCVALVPVAASVAADPAFAVAARAVGIEAGAVTWGRGVTLVAPLTVGDGRMVSVHARADGAGPVSELSLFAPGSDQAAQARFVVGEGATPLSLRLRVPRSQVVAAVVRHGDGRLDGIVAELRVV